MDSKVLQGKKSLYGLDSPTFVAVFLVLQVVKFPVAYFIIFFVTL